MASLSAASPPASSPTSGAPRVTARFPPSFLSTAAAARRSAIGPIIGPNAATFPFPWIPEGKDPTNPTTPRPGPTRKERPSSAPAFPSGTCGPTTRSPPLSARTACCSPCPRWIPRGPRSPAFPGAATSPASPPAPITASRPPCRFTAAASCMRTASGWTIWRK